MGPPLKEKTTGRPYKGKLANKRAIVSLVDRGGKVRSFHIPRADKATVAKIVLDNISHESRLHTDESRLYWGAGSVFAQHEAVNHSRYEYARGDVTTNSVEGYFSVFKRGMKGVYQHCSEKHLHRYVNEFTFRLNDGDVKRHTMDRIASLVDAAVGKRLTYEGLIS